MPAYQASEHVSQAPSAPTLSQQAVLYSHEQYPTVNPCALPAPVVSSTDGKPMNQSDSTTLVTRRGISTRTKAFVACLVVVLVIAVSLVVAYFLGAFDSDYDEYFDEYETFTYDTAEPWVPESTTSRPYTAARYHREHTTRYPEWTESATTRRFRRHDETVWTTARPRNTESEFDRRWTDPSFDFTAHDWGSAPQWWMEASSSIAEWTPRHWQQNTLPSWRGNGSW